MPFKAGFSDYLKFTIFKKYNKFDHFKEVSKYSTTETKHESTVLLKKKNFHSEKKTMNVKYFLFQDKFN